MIYTKDVTMIMKEGAWKNPWYDLREIFKMCDKISLWISQFNYV